MKRNIIIANNKPVFLLLFIFLAIVSCRLDVPVKEMAEAKMNISRAEEVKAAKYAPGELKKAGEELIKAHDNVKTEGVKDAKKSALESLKYSEAAITKSLPLLADDTLKEARSIYDEAGLSDAEKYAPEDFSLAGTKIKEAETLFGNTEYWDSYNKSVEAMNYAVSARDKSRANVSAMREKIKSIQTEADVLKAHGADEYAPDEMKTIETNLKDADNNITGNNLKEAFTNISGADAALKAASVKTWKGYASVKLKAAESASQAIVNSPAKESNADALGKADVLISESKALFEKESYQDSAAKSEEALGILGGIKTNENKTVTEEMGTKKPSEENAGKEEGTGEGVIMPAITEYVVKYNSKSRDCLWRIAEYAYKDARMWPLIYMANKDKIKDPDLIFPGQKFIVPPIPKKVTETKIENKVKK